MTKRKPRANETGKPEPDQEQTLRDGGTPRPKRKSPATGPADHYELLEEIGAGGMGVVYRASDTRLLRTVAIKILKEDGKQGHNSQGARRFIAEARITGRLQHPGIPPVHELGTLADGRPFLAMKLVQGKTLSQLLRRRDDSAEELGRFVGVFEQICHAVGYAHSQGVIHRDLKPSNIMVGDHGEVQVMDWGLAKVLSESSLAEGQWQAPPPPEAPQRPFSEDAPFQQGAPNELQATITHFSPGSTSQQDDSATQIGQALGTPAYMAPEQANGRVDQLDPRCDVFGLGAILCEMLTGRPPYTGRHVHEVLLKARRSRLDEAWERLDVCQEDPELVALCRRCLAADKEARPADGNAVAQAVERIRQQAEQRARQAELEKAEALVREAEQRKRRRYLLCAAAAVVLVLAVGVVGTTLGMLRAERNRRAAEAARAQAQASAQDALRSQRQALVERDAKSEAVARLLVALTEEQKARRQAMAALRFMTDDAIRDEMAAGKHIPAHRRRYLEKVVEYYEGFAHIRGQREEARAIRAEGYVRVGHIQFYLGQNEAALKHLLQAATIYRQLVRDYPSQPEYRAELAHALNRLAWMLIQTADRFDEAEKLGQEAMQAATWLVERFPREPKYQQALASSHGNLGTVYWNTRSYDQAERQHQQAIQLYERLVRQFPQVAEYRNDLAASFHNLGMVYRSTSRYSEAEKQYQKALELRQELVRQFPHTPEYRNDLAAGYNNLGNVFENTGRHAEAQQQYQKAIDLRAELVRQFPGVPGYRELLASSHNNLGNVFQSTGRFAEAERHYQTAIGLRQALVEQFPDVPRHRNNLAGSHNNLGNVYDSTGRFAQAEKHYQKALQLRNKLVQEFPDSFQFRNDLADSCYNLGVLYFGTGRYALAESYHRKALKLRQSLAGQFPEVPRYRARLATSHHKLGNVYAVARRFPEAEKQYRLAIQLQNVLVQRFPQVPQFQGDLASSINNLALILGSAGHLQEAEKLNRQAIDLWEGLVRRFPRVARHRDNLANSHKNLGNVYLQQRRYSQAQQQFSKAAELWSPLAERFARVSRYRERLVFCYEMSGRAGLLADRRAEAEDALRKAAAQWEHLAQTTPPKPRLLYNAACMLALAARAARERRDLDQSARRKAYAAHAEQAMRLLNQAVKQGFADLELMKKDTDLEPLRQREDFQALLEQLEAKSRTANQKDATK